MDWGYKDPELPPVDDGLFQATVAYLVAKGWYFDHERYRETWDEVAGPRGVREAHCWTMPQWGDYWHKPFADDPNHENYGAPPTRRYEALKDAIWSQILREQEPKQFEGFYAEKNEAAQ